ncbi:MAG: replication-relaxation family protein [Patescibacteria group bacterium]|nr:replication-relaxation family protein [Patescibacteria group bacterium]
MTKLITQKQQEILTLLYKYRFLNRIQIQTFLNHKYHKRINDWLKDLNQKEYINRIYSTNFGENTKPAIYYIGLNGIRYLKTQDDCSLEVLQKRYRDKDRSESFIDQCILVGDIVLQLKECAQKSKEEGEYELAYFVATATDIANPEYRFNFLSEIKPDLLMKRQKTKKSSKRTKSLCFLFLVLPPTLPRYSIRKRVKDIIRLYYEGDWEATEELPFPSIMIICPTLSTLIYTKRMTRKLLEDEDNPEDLQIQFTTIEKAKKEGVTGKIWESA